MEGGVIQHYVEDSGGYGFIQSDQESFTSPRDDVHLVSFRLVNCNVQSPPPRVGECVVFSRDPTNPLKATALYRIDASTTPAVPPTARSQPTPALSGINKDYDNRLRHLATLPPFYQGGALPRFVFVDMDNIWVSFVKAAHILPRFPGATTPRELELDLVGLTRRLAQGQTGSSIVRLVAFYFHTPERIMNRLTQLEHDGVQWDVRKQETASDTSMQLELLDFHMPCAAHQAKTLVLVTGDGNVAPNGMTFRKIVQKYLLSGWFVEIHAWLANLASSYIKFQEEYADKVVIRPLDDDHVGEIVRSRASQPSPPQTSLRTHPPATHVPATIEIPGIIVLYSAESGLGSIVKLDGSASPNVNFSIGDCDVQFPAPAASERVTIQETTGPNGTELTMVRRTSIRTAASKRSEKIEGQPTVTTPHANHAVSSVSTVYCFICLEDEPVEEIFYVNGCDHTFCREAIRMYILDRIDNQDVMPKCPHPECRATIGDAELTSVLTLEEQERYYDTCMRKAVLLDPFLHACRQQGCRGIVELPTNDPHFVCPVCRAEHCVQCNTTAWHDGLTCDQAQEQERRLLQQLREMFGGLQ